MLDRYYQAALTDGTDPVVRITSDCPVIDPELIDRVVERLTAGLITRATSIRTGLFLSAGSTWRRSSSPHCSAAWRDDREPMGREHVTPFLYRHPERFRMALVESDRPEVACHRWSVDTPEDYELLQRIYAHFRNDSFGWVDVLELLDQHPDWIEINSHIEQKPH